MRRVSRQACEEGPLLEDQETEGQRQLHRLLLQQLHTDVDINRCVAKRQCFAPAARYQPFGEQAEGVRSLSQFQALQEGEKELASLRELGLTDAEIQLWQRRDDPEAAEKIDKTQGYLNLRQNLTPNLEMTFYPLLTESRGLRPGESRGVRVAPDAKQERLQIIKDKMEAREKLLARPQRFAASRPLSRREMEIEQALFQGNDRLGFLTALYHRDEEGQKSLQAPSSSDPMDSVYRDVLSSEKRASAQDSDGESAAITHTSTRGDVSDRTPNSQPEDPPGHQSELQMDRPAAPVQIKMSQPIRSLCGPAAAAVGSAGPLTVKGEIEMITDEEILKNREPEEGIRSIPRFRNYQTGKPSKVLCVKNLSSQASVAQLVALFSRFEQTDGPPVLYRLLTGRMKGQAFITLPDAGTAQNALQLLHGYRLLGKPLVVEFGRERQEEEKQKEQEGQKKEK